VVVAMGLKKQVYHVKTELVKRLQRQRRHYFATGLCSTMCAPRRWQLIIRSAKTSRHVIFVDELENK